MFSGITSYLFGSSSDVAQNETSDVESNDRVGTLYIRNRKTGDWNCHFLEAKVKFQPKGKFLCDLCIERLGMN